MANVGLNTPSTGTTLGAVVKTINGEVIPSPKTGEIWPRGSKVTAG